MPGIHVAMTIAWGLLLSPCDPLMPGMAVPAVTDRPLCCVAQGREQKGAVRQ